MKIQLTLLALLCSSLFINAARLKKGDVVVTAPIVDDKVINTGKQDQISGWGGYNNGYINNNHIWADGKQDQKGLVTGGYGYNNGYINNNNIFSDGKQDQKGLVTGGYGYNNGYINSGNIYEDGKFQNQKGLQSNWGY